MEILIFLFIGISFFAFLRSKEVISALEKRIYALEQKNNSQHMEMVSKSPEEFASQDTFSPVENINNTIATDDVSIVSQNTATTQVLSSDTPHYAMPLSSDRSTPNVSLDWNWLKTDWPMKVGAFFLIAAIGWFVTYAFVNDWIGPMGRIALGMLFGCTLLGFGTLRAQKNHTQGNVLVFVGALALLITMLAGIDYEFFSPVVGFFVMFLISAYIGTLAYLQDNVHLATVSTIFGGGAPLFFGMDSDINIVFIYLFVLCLGILFFAYAKWRQLALLGLFMVSLYTILYGAFDGFDKTWINVLFAFAFIGIFYGTNLRALISEAKPAREDLIVAGWTGMLLLLWMSLVAPSEEARTFLVVFGAILFSIGALILYILSSSKYPVYVYSAVSMTLLATATAFEFKGNALTIAYAFEFGLLSIVSMYLSRNEVTLQKIIAFGTIILMTLPFLLSQQTIAKINFYINNQNNTSIPSDFFYQSSLTHINIMGEMLTLVLLALIALALAFAVYTLRSDKLTTDTPAITFMKVFSWLSAAYTLLVFWFSLHLIIQDFYIASMIALIILTIIGLIFYLTGSARQNTSLISIGMILLALVGIRLMFIEFWVMTMAVKIITFFIIGILFISTAFLRKNIQ